MQTDAKDLNSWLRASCQNKPRDSLKDHSTLLEELRLPRVGNDHRNSAGKGRSSHAWKLQTYEDFASKTESRNGGVKFDKSLMDECFRYQVDKTVPVSKKKASWANQETVEKMLARVSSALSGRLGALH